MAKSVSYSERAFEEALERKPVTTSESEASSTSASMSESFHAIKFKAGLKLLPVASVREKLEFPVKFDREKFCLEFSSESPSSDCEPTSVRLRKL